MIEKDLQVTFLYQIQIFLRKSLLSLLQPLLAVLLKLDFYFATNLLLA